jgi:hypothetical protein
MGYVAHHTRCPMFLALDYFRTKDSRGNLTLSFALFPLETPRVSQIGGCHPRTTLARAFKVHLLAKVRRASLAFLHTYQPSVPNCDRTAILRRDWMKRLPTQGISLYLVSSKLDTHETATIRKGHLDCS